MLSTGVALWQAFVRMAVSLVGAVLPSLVRLSLGVPPLGYGTRVHAIVVLSAVIH